MKSTALFSKPPSRKHSRKRQSVKLTIWMQASVYAEIERIAHEELLSLSSVGATGLSEWVRWKIHSQQEALFYPKLRQMIREERHASENRIIFFLMRTAYASEQSRILITNVLKWLLKLFWLTVKPPKTDKAQDFNDLFNNLVADSHLMAQQNILTKTAQMKRLHEAWQEGREEGGTSE